MRYLYLSLACVCLSAPFTLAAADTSYTEQVDTANAAAKRGEFDGALNSLNAAIAQHPQEPRAYRIRANIYFVHQDYAKALDDLSHFAELTDRKEDACLDRAVIYLAMQDYSAALEEVEKTLQIDSLNDRAHVIAAAIRSDALQSKAPDRLVRLRKKGEKLRK